VHFRDYNFLKMPAQDEILRNIRVVAQGLDALRDEHEAKTS